jgi:hypothetical protein
VVTNYHLTIDEVVSVNVRTGRLGSIVMVVGIIVKSVVVAVDWIGGPAV